MAKTKGRKLKKAPGKPASSEEATNREKLKQEEAENALWEKAKKANTVSAYRKYVDESTAGLYKVKALQLIKQLEDDQKDKELEKLLWEKAKVQNTLNAYRHYIEEYPTGIYNADAQAAIKRLEESAKRPLHLQEENVVNFSGGQPKKGSTKKYIIIAASVVIVALGTWWLVTQNNHKPATGRSTASLEMAATVPLNQDSINKVQEKNRQDSISSANEKIKKDSIATRDSIGIGRTFRGGIIFSIDETGMHGLMAYPKDLDIKLNWDDANTRCKGLGDGWRLPDLDELILMYRKIGSGANAGGFQKMFYWSSRENGDKAYGVYFNYGGNTDGYKNLPKFVRPVRRF